MNIHVDILVQNNNDQTVAIEDSNNAVNEVVHTLEFINEMANSRSKSAEEMYEEARRAYTDADAGILCAAVADFTPDHTADHKIKRGKDGMTIQLKPTKDIAASLGATKKEGQVLVGFALETNDEQQNAKGKLERKNFDFIVLNSLNDKGAGFRVDTNKISIIDRQDTTSYSLKDKSEVAKDIIDRLVQTLNKN